MKAILICKLHYTNKNLLLDKFGRLYHFPVQLKKLGIDISVIALDYRSRKITSVLYENVEFKTHPFHFKTLLTDLYKLDKVITEINPHVIIASGDSHIGYIGLKLSKKISCKFIFDVYDYYPAFKSNKIPGMKHLFWKSIKKADSILCASTPLLNKLTEISQKVFYIPNGVDLKIFNHTPQEKARNLKKLQKEKGPLIGYFGSMTKHQGPLLIEACKKLRSKYPDLKLLLAGNNKNLDLSMEWILYFGTLPQKDVANLICCCDVVSIPYEKSIQINYSGACKIPEYLACKIPVVATNVSNHIDFFHYNEISICEPSVQSLLNAIENQLTRPTLEPFRSDFEWKNISKKLKDIIYKLQ